jgi:hypothetical protein
MVVAREEIPTIQAQRRAMLPVESSKPDDTGYLDLEVDGPDPVVVRLFLLDSQTT